MEQFLGEVKSVTWKGDKEDRYVEAEINNDVHKGSNERVTKAIINTTDEYYHIVKIYINILTIWRL